MDSTTSSSASGEDFGLFTSLRYDIQLISSQENTLLSGNGQPSPFHNIRFHYDRLLDALHAFGWRLRPSTDSTSENKDVERGDYPKAFEPIRDLEIFRSALINNINNYHSNSEINRDEPLKLRVRLYRTGDFFVDISSTPPVSLHNLYPPNPLPPPSIISASPLSLFLNEENIALIDTEPMTPSHYTRFKTWPRPHYESARTRMGLTETESDREVLVWNEHNRLVMEGSRTNVYFWRPLLQVPKSDEEPSTTMEIFGWITPSEQNSGCLSGTERRWMLERGMITVQDLNVDDVQYGEVVLLSNALRGTWPATIQKKP